MVGSYMEQCRCSWRVMSPQRARAHAIIARGPVLESLRSTPPHIIFATVHSPVQQCHCQLRFYLGIYM